MSDPFALVVPEDRACEAFRTTRDNPGAAPAKAEICRIFQTFHDADGNFLEQLQTTAFDARIFELYLHAYFQEAGFRVLREHDRPDFIVEHQGLQVCIEATTVNPSGALDQRAEGLSLKDRQGGELPIRFGGPLYSKLKKRYWDLPHVKGRPLVLAVEAFFSEDALHFSDSALVNYLFGITQTFHYTPDGQLVVQQHPVESHEVGGKVIPSGFFSQPDSEHISAVMFTNSGTQPKFNRMGFIRGNYPNISMIRVGKYYDITPNASEPLDLKFDVKQAPYQETYGNGLSIALNPNARVPLPRDFFPGAAQHYMDQGTLYTDTPEFHPFVSVTMVFVKE
ncbi:glycosaminoglycan attachment protein [Deinococcus humi]|uniref:Glycosaminoglycan attachment site n=1 Tax=Deinococcus humi TaxID=662880 RepID=A0A7W8NG35_9DEIO|nr:glycosaminoglycan attachment protein [Deinococcus humi]MBB5366119.1 hypothetical protein [Deinococcus humi]GGO40180.1 hypothetical protein GCM10008949_49370 [Deinococcus humi]